MCGIAGYITNKKYSNFSFEEASKNLKLIMKNRGPDQQGSFCHSTNNYIVNLFSSRLSVIDLDSRSNQPFRSGDLIVIFNGEIYNYLELRKYLQNKGVYFRTNSDTEVLIKSYKYWGENLVVQQHKKGNEKQPLTFSACTKSFFLKCASARRLYARL